MSTEPLFSIVIPTLNRGALLERCLDALSRQEFTDFETIVIDGGSTDGTQQVLARFVPRVSAIEVKGAGVSESRNTGVQRARGRFIVFHDSDDLLTPSALRTYASVLQGSQPPRLLLAAFRPFADDAEVASPEAPAAPEVRRFDTYLDAADEGHLSGTHRLVIDRAAYLDAGGLSSAMHVCEDQDFGLRINQLGPCAVILAPATVGYRLHAGNISRNAAEFARGARSLIRHERAGLYPGGAADRRRRRSLIARTARAASVGCLEHRHYRAAIDLYLSTLPWHLGQVRMKYVVGFPLRALASMARPTPASPARPS